MSITVLTRFRKQGPGFPVVTGQLGVLEQWAWWYPYNKLGNTYINGRQTLGSKQVTWDNVHPFFATGRKAFVSSPRRVNPPKEPKVPWVHTPYKGKHPKAPKPPKVQVKRVKELKMKPLRKRWDFVAPSDIGGDFTSVILCDNSALQGVRVYNYPGVSGAINRYQYSGGFVPAWPATSQFGTETDMQNAGTSGKFTSSFGEGTSYGASAWRKFTPKLATADMGQFVGEIREALPMLKTTCQAFVREYRQKLLRRMSGKTGRNTLAVGEEAAGHWLNTQFGWSPFIGDMLKLVESFGNVDRKLNQAIRDNGHYIKRGGTVMVQEGPETFVADSSLYTCSQYVNPNGNQFAYLGGRLPDNPTKTSFSRITYKESYRVWFEAKFRYWIPSFDSPSKPMNVLTNMLRMYGIQITPLLVWNLTPWSWLADWVGNIGDNIANYSSALNDGLTAKYAYIMKSTTGELINRSKIALTGYPPVELEWKRTFVAKTRRHASQYGFTIDWPSFSAKQWSILAALGWGRLKIETRPG